MVPSLSSVEFVVLGAGGLGCPALSGLVGAGARRITIVDHDHVEVSNLQRQILFDVTTVGMPKAQAAAAQLRRRCHGLQARPRIERLDPTTVVELVAALPRPAVVLECTDQPVLKFAVNDACVALGVPLVIGAALRWSGQAMAVRPPAACYRCIYEAPPPDALLPTCEGAGVLGPVVGTIGAWMAHLAVATALERPETTGRLTTIDLRAGLVRTLAPSPRPSCPACRAFCAATSAAHLSS
jgi:molybdopterin/thiamine biosynthesis adenylyltransferase